MLVNDVKLKVCGMKWSTNILEVGQLKPDYLGFIFYEKSPRYIDKVSAELIKYVPEEIKTVGVFVNENIDRVKELIILHRLNAVQLHGNESVDFCRTLKDEFSNIEIIKAFGVDENFNFDELNHYEFCVDYFLFDTKTQNHGGSGKQFNWSYLKNYTLSKPYFLSGGIDINDDYNIKQLTDERLYAIDINSKFEIEPGLKDVQKIEKFVKALNQLT